MENKITGTQSQSNFAALPAALLGELAETRVAADWIHIDKSSVHRCYHASFPKLLRSLLKLTKITDAGQEKGIHHFKDSSFTLSQHYPLFQISTLRLQLNRHKIYQL